jgi:membrane-associated phospholipid phosphatase
LLSRPLPAIAPGTEPTLKQFPRELLRNFTALVSIRNLPPLLVGAAATGLAKVPNERVQTFFLTEEKYAFHEGGDFMGLAYVAGPTIAGLMLAGRKSDDARFRSFTYSLAQGFVINQSIAQGIKMAVRSERPVPNGTYSFPSGHTSSAFTWATTVQHYYGWKAGMAAYLAASYVGFSRMDDHSHRLTDVVAGAALGYIVGSTVSRRANPNRALDWNVTVPPGGGVGATVQYHLGRRR